MNRTYTKQLGAEGKSSLQAKIDVGSADNTAKQATDEDSSKCELMRLFDLVGVDGKWLRAVRVLASARAGKMHKQILTHRDRHMPLPRIPARSVLLLPS